MTIRRLLSSFAILLASAAWAQGADDLLSPLAPSPAAEKPEKPKGHKKKRTSHREKAQSGAGDDVPLAPLVEKSGLRMTLTPAVPGAHLFIDDLDFGPVPERPVELLAGEHKVEIKKEGYQDFQRQLNVKAGTLSEVSVTLQPLVGMLAVNADAPDSEVYLDGVPKGIAPVSSISLPPGPHEVQVRRPGYDPDSTHLEVVAGKEYTWTAHLRPMSIARSDSPSNRTLTPRSEPSAAPASSLEASQRASIGPPPWYRRWYVWVGAGAVAAVAAGVVGGTVWANSQVMSPQRVCGGPCVAINSP